MPADSQANYYHTPSLRSALDGDWIKAGEQIERQATLNGRMTLDEEMIEGALMERLK